MIWQGYFLEVLLPEPILLLVTVFAKEKQVYTIIQKKTTFLKPTKENYILCYILFRISIIAYALILFRTRMWRVKVLDLFYRCFN